MSRRFAPPRPGRSASAEVHFGRPAPAMSLAASAARGRLFRLRGRRGRPCGRMELRPTPPAGVGSAQPTEAQLPLHGRATSRRPVTRAASGCSPRAGHAFSGGATGTAAKALAVRLLESAASRQDGRPQGDRRGRQLRKRSRQRFPQPPSPAPGRWRERAGVPRTHTASAFGCRVGDADASAEERPGAALASAAASAVTGPSAPERSELRSPPAV